MKKTAFYDNHIAMGAKIVEFAGFQMPLQYSGIIQEHKRVRSTVGVFDVSHMGEFEVRGPGAAAFVQRMTTNDVGKLSEGRVQYSTMLYDHGGIVDDLLVYHLGESFMLVVNAANIEKDFAWLKEHVTSDVELIDTSDETSLLAVQGPRSRDTLKKLTDTTLEDLAYYHWIEGTLAGVDVLISRTGYTGELGYEIYMRADPVSNGKLFNALMEAGKEYDIEPVGLGARDTLRLEMGYCLYGNDIDESTNPLEAGLGWITKLKKGEFTGREALLKVKEEGVQRRLVGMVVEGKAFPRHGYDITTNGTPVGKVTSGTFSPILEKGIAMGYVPIDFTSEGTTLGIVIRGKTVSARVVKLPFLQK